MAPRSGRQAALRGIRLDCPKDFPGGSRSGRPQEVVLGRNRPFWLSRGNPKCTSSSRPSAPGSKQWPKSWQPSLGACEPPVRPLRAATVSQTRAIRAIASRRRIDLPGLLQERFGVAAAAELGIRQASELIDELKADEDGFATTNGHANGNDTYAAKGGAR